MNIPRALIARTIAAKRITLDIVVGFDGGGGAPDELSVELIREPGDLGKIFFDLRTQLAAFEERLGKLESKG